MIKTNIEERINNMLKGDKVRSKKQAILKELSALLNISKDQLYRIRTNQSMINLNQASIIADFFGCSIDDLILQEEENIAA